VVCADIDDQSARMAAAEIKRAGGDAVAMKVDVADEDSVGKLAQSVLGEFSRLDVLINNAGVASVPARLLDLPLQEWDRVTAVNLRGLFLCTKAFLPMLLENETASVVNLSSILAMKGTYPGFPVTAIGYGTTKAGVIGFTRQLAMEYASEGLRVNAIAPGWHMGTNLGRERRASATAEELAHFESYLKGTIPMGRFGTPDDLSGLVIYLASDASRYVTGQIFAHDGGITAG
jgi:NAD(P)-dependent dehydrogenase (short-subunit alcohol dehydrogenase family)